MAKDWLALAPKSDGAGKEESLGRPQAAERLARIRAKYGPPATALLLLDTSGSMGHDQKLEVARNGALGFARSAVERGYRVGLIVFASEAALVAEPAATVSGLSNAVQRVRADGLTNLTAALEEAARVLGGEGTRAVVVATDGMPDRPATALAAADRLKEHGVRIITIGTPDADQAFLARLASHGDLSAVVANADLGRQIASSAQLLALPGTQSG